MSPANLPIRSLFARGLSALIILAATSGAQGFRYWNPADTGKAPKLISETGLYPSLATGGKVIASARYFEVNSALWSDGAVKKRWFILKPNQAIGFKEKGDYFDYPDSTVFVKQFSIEVVPGDSTSRILWETRFLVLRKEATDPAFPGRLEDRWYGFSYRWRADQKEADLVPDTGMKATVNIYPKGRIQGEPPVAKKWIFPSRDECQRCHQSGRYDTLQARSVLGFLTAQLNRPSSGNTSVNQLQEFFDKGWLKGVRPASWEKAPRWYGLDSKDPLATFEVRSRSYLAANCSGCHSENGFSFSGARGPDFDFHGMQPRMKLEYMQASWDRNLGDVDPVAPSDDPIRGVYVITPGYPQKSVALYRLKDRNTAPPNELGWDPARDQMPPLATFEVDTAALAVLSEWIRTLPKKTIAVNSPLSAGAFRAPSFRGRTLIVPGPGAPGNARVTLIGVDGREVELTRRGPGAYDLPAGTPAGVYVIRVGSASFARSLL